MTQYQASNPKPANRHLNVKKLSEIALMVTLALIFSYVEAIIPYNPGIPGIKLGIANIVAIIALYKFSWREAVTVNAIRIIIAGLLFNGVFGAIYSMAGSLVSLLGMVILKKSKLFSVAGVSMAGGVLHNVGQLFVATFIIEDVRIFFYFPVLLFSGLIAGLAIGIAADIILRRLKITEAH